MQSPYCSSLSMWSGRGNDPPASSGDGGYIPMVEVYLKVSFRDGGYNSTGEVHLSKVFTIRVDVESKEWHTGLP